jgi:NADH-quinone oxidoreductase subunit J
MTLAPAFFYLFAFVTVASGFMVIWAKNPVHAVLFLILAFFNAAGLFVLLGAEFLAMILVVVYVGAVAVLFLFVVMMLDVDFAELRAGFIKNAPLGAAVGLILLAELVLMIGFYFVKPGAVVSATAPIPALNSGITNTEAIGLTLRHKEGVKRQSIRSQVTRNKASAMDVVKIAPGTATVPPPAE